jgi:hypothetical protein
MSRAVDHAETVAAHFDDVRVAVCGKGDAERLVQAALHDERCPTRRRRRRSDQKAEPDDSKADWVKWHLSPVAGAAACA